MPLAAALQLAPHLVSLAADGAWRHDVEKNAVMAESDVDRLAAAIRLLEITIRKESAAKEVMARKAAAAKAPPEPIARVGHGGRPILSLKQA